MMSVMWGDDSLHQQMAEMLQTYLPLRPIQQQDSVSGNKSNSWALDISWSSPESDLLYQQLESFLDEKKHSPCSDQNPTGS